MEKVTINYQSTGKYVVISDINSIQPLIVDLDYTIDTPLKCKAVKSSSNPT